VAVLAVVAVMVAVAVLEDSAQTSQVKHLVGELLQSLN
jgi:hypothetical protein